MRARYYDPSNGTFNQRDTFTGNNFDPQSLYKYAYANCDPINGLDLSGNITLLEFVITSAIVGSIAGGIIGGIANGWRGALNGIVIGGLLGVMTGFGVFYAGAGISAFTGIYQAQGLFYAGTAANVILAGLNG